MTAPRHPQPPTAITAARGTERATAECAWWRDGNVWTVRLTGPFGVAEGTATDAFEALCEVRRRIEPDGWRIGLMGALPTVWPSGMARDMGSGLVAYRLEPGRKVGREDLVDVFAPADVEAVTDLDTQRATTAAIIG